MLLSIQDLKVAFRMGRGVRAEAVKGVSFDIAVTLLPDPDSPTSATVVFSGMSKLTPLTASASWPRPMRKLTARS